MSCYLSICESVKDNNKYMKNYDKNKESSYPDTSQFNEDFIKIYDQDSDIGCFIEGDFQYPERLHKLCNDLPFLPERMKMENMN